MAVAVEDSPTVVVDDQYRVVDFSPAAAPWFAQHVGRELFECFPGCRSLFRPYYEQARRTGEEVAFAQFFDGYLTYVTARPHEAGLAITWETLGMLDTWTLDGLRASLQAALERLDRRCAELARARVRRHLRLVEGGA
ncbi:MAG TPA: hypothetical protein VNJ53_09640 [Gaiellaceae bacterium]|nr:hypothetical protein [Gaiellaceae bacterium]